MLVRSYATAYGARPLALRALFMSAMNCASKPAVLANAAAGATTAAVAPAVTARVNVTSRRQSARTARSDTTSSGETAGAVAATSDASRTRGRPSTFGGPAD